MSYKNHTYTKKFAEPTNGGDGQVYQNMCIVYRVLYYMLRVLRVVQEMCCPLVESAAGN